MSQPLIGVTTYTLFTKRHHLYERTQAVAENYVTMVERAGGLPVLIPSNLGGSWVEELTPRLDGILLTGGPDVDPVHFGQEPHPALGKVDPIRDETEIVLSRVALEKEIPVLAVCRGIQILNIAFGGTLFQDIVSQVPGHVGHEIHGVHDGPGHTVNLVSGTRLAGMLDDDALRVNSNHHQAVDELGEDLVVCGRSTDDVIEAIEHADHPFMLGLQWHLERNWKRAPESSVILEAFLAACRG